MKEMFKKLAVAGSGFALLAGTAFANVGNSGTGENSLNNVNLDDMNKVIVDVDNDAHLDNDVDVDANTGFNFIASMNEEDNHGCRGHNECNEESGVAAGDRTITTGDADASAEVTNRVNRTTIEASMPGNTLGDIGNMDTGKNSENNVCVESENQVDVDVNNDAHVYNDLDVNANTGFNAIISGGRGDSTINTGNATASATVTNEVNTTSVTVQ